MTTEIKIANIMEAVPLVEDAQAITVQVMKRKHFDQLDPLRIMVDESMPDHTVIGQVKSESMDYVLIRVDPNFYKMWLTDYIKLALGMDDDNVEAWWKVKRQLERDLPQILTS